LRSIRVYEGGSKSSTNREVDLLTRAEIELKRQLDGDSDNYCLNQEEEEEEGEAPRPNSPHERVMESGASLHDQHDPRLERVSSLHDSEVVQERADFKVRCLQCSSEIRYLNGQIAR